MIRPNIKPPKHVSHLQFQIFGESFPLSGGNLLLETQPGGQFVFSDDDMVRMSFGDRVAEVFDGTQYTVPKKIPSVGIIVSKELYERLQLNKNLLKFISQGHGELRYWNVDNDGLAKNGNFENPMFEATFNNANPHAFVAMIVSAIKENFAVYSLPQCGLKTIEAIPEISRYIKQNEQSKYRG